METLDRERLGRCYELAGRYVLEHPDADALVHGSIEGMGQPRIGHAWVEVVGGVWEPVTASVWSWTAFMAVFDPRMNDRWSNAAARDRMLRAGHFGPWR